MNVSIIGDTTLLFATVANVAPNASTSKIQIWTSSGSKAGSVVSVTVSFNASI